MLVIADTGPVNYLLLIGHIDILPTLFGTVILPSAVRDEFADVGTPRPVHDWIADPPSWIDVHPPVTGCPSSESLKSLDSGRDLMEDSLDSLLKAAGPIWGKSRNQPRPSNSSSISGSARNLLVPASRGDIVEEAIMDIVKNGTQRNAGVQ